MVKPNTFNVLFQFFPNKDVLVMYMYCMYMYIYICISMCICICSDDSSYQGALPYQVHLHLTSCNVLYRWDLMLYFKYSVPLCPYIKVHLQLTISSSGFYSYLCVLKEAAKHTQGGGGC